MDFYARLSSLAQSRLDGVTKTRGKTWRDQEDPDDTDPEIIALKKLKTDIRDDWQRVSEEYTSTHGGGQLDEELIVGYIEGAMRDFILDAAVSRLERTNETSSSCMTSTFSVRRTAIRKRSRH
jgi:hypothetical protein